jgi:hypothetical protein
VSQDIGGWDCGAHGASHLVRNLMTLPDAEIQIDLQVELDEDPVTRMTRAQVVEAAYLLVRQYKQPRRTSPPMPDGEDRALTASAEDDGLQPQAKPSAAIRARCDSTAEARPSRSSAV